MNTDLPRQTDRDSVLHRALETSRAVDLYRRVEGATRRPRHSTTACRLAEAAASSGSKAAVDLTTNTARKSYLYRWFTGDPGGTETVIDLEETYTIGAILAGLDRIAPAVRPAWPTSHVSHVVGRFESAIEFVSTSKTGRTVSRMLRPPDPPNDAD